MAGNTTATETHVANADHGEAGVPPFDPKVDVARIMTGPMAVMTQDGLHMVEAESPGAIFVKPPRPNLFNYTKIMLAPVAALPASRRPDWTPQLLRHLALEVRVT